MPRAWRTPPPPPPPVKPYGLHLYGPVTDSASFREDITGKAEKWTRASRLRGGFWTGSFEVRADTDTLETWLYDRLGYRVTETVGRAVTWEGLIYEVDLIRDGIRRRRSLDQMANHVIVNYTTPSNEQKETSAQSNAKSITRFGRKESRIAASNMPDAAATAYALTVLRESAWANPKPIGLGERAGESYAKVSVCGYAFTANWRHVSATTLNGESAAINTIISATLTNDCELVTAGRISANALSAARQLRSPMRAWEFVDKLARMGDASGNAWRAYVGAGRKLHYEMIGNTPALYLRDGVLYKTAGMTASINPYTIQPGIVRDSSRLGRRFLTENSRTDSRDILIEEVEVNADGKLILKAGSQSESELIAAQYRGL